MVLFVIGNCESGIGNLQAMNISKEQAATEASLIKTFNSSKEQSEKELEAAIAVKGKSAVKILEKICPPALYDIEDEALKSYAKAFEEDPDIDFVAIYDDADEVKESLQEQLGEKYKVETWYDMHESSLLG